MKNDANPTFAKGKHYVFDVVAFMDDMDIEELPDDHWAYKIDGKQIINVTKLKKGGQHVGYVKGFKGGLYPEWCKKVNK